jgi:PAS domain S-box-containing protein
VIEREELSNVEAWRARAPIAAPPNEGSSPLSLVDALPLPAAETDAQGRLLRVNDAFCKLTARSAAELRDKPLAELLHPDDRAGALADVERLRHAREGCVRSARFLKPDGALLAVRSSLSPAAAGTLDERSHGLLLLLDSDTQQSSDEERHRDDFLSVLSHELRSPIGAILMWVRLLQQGGFDASGSGRALTIVERSARSLERIVEDLLHVSRISAGKLSLAVQPLELGAVVEAAVESAQGDAALKGVSLKLRRTSGPIQMRGDPLRLQQAVGNLLSNAVKFTPSGGNVIVGLEPQGGEARIQVADDGAGMSPDFLPAAFERFRPRDGSGARGQHGLGLGLYIVRHLVELHGGCVKAESPGRGAGSTFTIVLPSATHTPAPQREPVEPAPRPAHSIPKGLRVLVVDDDEDTREALKVILQQNGLQVFIAGSATDGLAKLEQLKPQLLLSDVAMPVEDGYSLIRRVRGLPREKGGEIPAAALTAYAGVDDRRSALAAGFQFHISKPIDQDRLLEVVAAMARTLEA